MKKNWKLLIIAAVIFCLVVPSAFSGGRKEAPEEGEAESFDIGVYVGGVVAGSPLYEQMVAGAERAASEYGHVSVKVLEAGFNQGEWVEKMMSMVATQEYELIVASNGSMPDVAMPAAEAFPDQKFLLVDAILPGHPQMFTLLYNQVEQAAFVGYLGGLITKSDMQGATPDLKLGMIVGQEYPAMENMIRPGFEQGAREVDPGIEVDFRVLGNWYDANKAADLANSMFDAGVDAILPVCGGANQGVIQAAKDRGKYILFVDSDDYGLAPGTLVGCAIVRQDQAVYELIKKAIEGQLNYGEAMIVNVQDGYVDFADWNPLYKEALPEDILAQMEAMLEQVRAGKISMEVPKFW